MTVRLTSKMAHLDLNRDGTGYTQKESIMHILALSAPMSLREICKMTGYEINAVSGRVNDLKKEGRVVECSRRKCRITGRSIIPVTTAREPSLFDTREVERGTG